MMIIALAIIVAELVSPYLPEIGDLKMTYAIVAPDGWIEIDRRECEAAYKHEMSDNRIHCFVFKGRERHDEKGITETK